MRGETVKMENVPIAHAATVSSSAPTVHEHVAVPAGTVTPPPEMNNVELVKKNSLRKSMKPKKSRAMLNDLFKLSDGTRPSSDESEAATLDEPTLQTPPAQTA